MLPPKPVFRRADIRRIPGGYPADIRAPEESSGWIFRDVTDESGRISLPIGRNREESGDGRSGRTGPRPPPLSSLFQPMGREMRPRRHGKSIRRTPPEGGYPPDFRRISAGYPPGIRRISAGYPASGKRVLGPGVLATKITIGNQNRVPSAQVAEISISKKYRIEVKHQFCRIRQFGGFCPDCIYII